MSDFSEFNGFELLVGIDYQLTSPLVWEVGRKGSGLTVTVPDGYVFESSVPWYARWILSPHDRRFLSAAAVHDWLLENGHPKAFAASQWHDCVAAMGVARWFRLLAFIGMVLWTVK